MNCELSNRDEGMVLRIAGEVSVCDVSCIREHLLSAIQSIHPLVVELDDAAGFDTAVVQLLVCACKSASGMGKQMVISGMPPDMVATAGRIGINGVFAASD